MATLTLLLDLDGVLRHFDPKHVSSVKLEHALAPRTLTATAFDPDLLDSVITGRTSRSQWVYEVGARVSNHETATQ